MLAQEANVEMGALTISGTKRNQIVADEKNSEEKSMNHDPPKMISCSFQQFGAKKKQKKKTKKKKQKKERGKPRTSLKHSYRHNTCQGSGRTGNKLSLTPLYQYNGVWDIIRHQNFTAKNAKQQILQRQTNDKCNKGENTTWQPQFIPQ